MRRCLSRVDIEARHWLVARMHDACLNASIEGISHDSSDASHEDDIVLGCQVLAEAVLQLLIGNRQN